MANYMLIAGCSHAAGSEIDGTMSSPENREASFGNLLAKMLDHKPINIARNGSSNSAIHRSILNWFTLNKEIVENKNNNLFVLINWAESNRMEGPLLRPGNDVENLSHFTGEGGGNQDSSADWEDPTHADYVQVNVMTDPHSIKGPEKEAFVTTQRFLVYSPIYTEILTAKDALSMQYFLQTQDNGTNIRYLMTNSGIAFSDYNMRHLKPYLEKLDATRYYKYRDNRFGFYEKYKLEGMLNPNAKYGHHGADAHTARATDLANYIKQKNI